ncbi:MAG: hypothetical protein HYZ29_26175 [Myxococcales bacterium]|nr:hypothetical protein [Myxococcales bacterium]
MVRGFVVLALGCVACTPGGARSTRAGVRVPPASAGPGAERAAPAGVLSCAADDPPETIEWRQAAVIGHWGGKSFVRARRADASELLHLGPSGAIEAVALPVPAGERAVESARRVRFLDSSSSRWWALDLTDADAPKVESATPITDLPKGGTPKAFASDGQRALIGLYYVDYGVTPTRYHGKTALYAVPDGKRIGPEVPATAWAAGCAGRSCVAVASPDDRFDAMEITWLDDSGSRVLAQLDGECSGWGSWQVGDHFVVARPTASGLELFSVEITTGRTQKKSVPTGARCASVWHAELAGRAGVFLRAGSESLSFLPVDAELRTGDPEPFPVDVSYYRPPADLPDGTLVLDERSGGGMRHTPTDSRGVRRYYRTWSYSGRAVFLQRAARGWKEIQSRALPHSGEEGEHSSGYGAAALTRPGWARVLVTGDAGLAGSSIVLRKPCHAR